VYRRQAWTADVRALVRIESLGETRIVKAVVTP
jgi:hypothetical protein